jgi:hypothetical protein
MIITIIIIISTSSSIVIIRGLWEEHKGFLGFKTPLNKNSLQKKRKQNPKKSPKFVRERERESQAKQASKQAKEETDCCCYKAVKPKIHQKPKNLFLCSSLYWLHVSELMDL